MIDFVPIQFYTWIYYWILASFCLITAVIYCNSHDCSHLLQQNSGIFPLIVVVLLTLYAGLRPISGYYFVDMFMYAHGYRIADIGSPFNSLFNIKEEWFFHLIMVLSKTFIGNINVWFLIVEIFYMGCQFWACKRFLYENVWMAILFVFFSYQFWTFGTNGLRNGMGAALFMLALSFFCKRNAFGYGIGFFLFLLAMGCHRTVMLPMAALVASFYIIKEIRYAVIVWGISIFLSLVSGNFFVSLFSSLGFDDRMSSYASLETDRFSHSGFRWDFLLYSSMPVIFAWYIDRKGIKDKTFTLIANTYILSNAFWVLVCRMPYSNRVAYLSWFLYALVLAYGVIRVPIWKDQDRKAGQILLAHTAFTLGMQLIGK